MDRLGGVTRQGEVRLKSVSSSIEPVSKFTLLGVFAWGEQILGRARDWGGVQSTGALCACHDRVVTDQAK